MFGPDICGGTKRVHVIFNYAAKDENLLIKKEPKPALDQKSHLYTLHIKASGEYEVFIDDESKQTGTLEEGWDFLEPKQIKDPDVSKPEDWVDEKKIPDPEDVKPEGYDDIPKKILDPDAEKPDDWDDEDDGEWEAPEIDNPDYKGPWKPTMIDNPEYKGEWVHPMIANPDYAPDTYAKYPALNYVGFELWTVNAGSIFDNVLVTDDVEYASKMAAETYKKIIEGEKDAHEKHKKENEPEPSEEGEDEDMWDGEGEEDEEESHDEL